jgi:thiosulfate dehydrogenase
MRFLVGIVVGLLLVPCAVAFWLYKGNVPVAVDDPPLPQEGRITHVALDARINRDMIHRPPIQPDETVFVAGAHVYAQKCAVCHGVPNKTSPLGNGMFPSAPQLWVKHRNSNVVGVSDDEPGETYWKVANGIRLSGMPEFHTELSDTQVWQVSLLLANADKQLPGSVTGVLQGEAAAAVPAGK